MTQQPFDPTDFHGDEPIEAFSECGYGVRYLDRGMGLHSLIPLTACCAQPALAAGMTAFCSYCGGEVSLAHTRYNLSAFVEVLEETGECKHPQECADEVHEMVYHAAGF